MESTSGFDDFFKTATGGSLCFPYQRRFAEASELPALVNVPTGLGKTAMAVIGWLWRRQGASDERRTQTLRRRLVYCLPMRVLVEQTRDNAIRWLWNLERLGGQVTFDPPLATGERATPQHHVTNYTPCADDSGKIAVHILMGGEDEDNWDIYPERDAIIIGTQDMLLSRALNRGYAASRARWPMQFGLLHTDCLWVFDEIQLMGSGLATTAQLEAFRRQLGSADGHGCRSVWMSATMQPDWLKTVDFKDRVDNLSRLALDEDDHRNQDVHNRWNAKKPLQKAGAAMGDATALAGKVVEAHKSGTRTIIVVNTVNRARELHKQIRSQWGSDEDQRLVLLHSRFRPADRKKRVDEALADPPSGGTIIVSTQVIEAGVDVSATTLFTELAPWASLVQRFGRCNRRGEQNETASVRWIDLPAEIAAAEKARFPYELTDLRAAAEQLKELTDVGLESLAAHRQNLSDEEHAALFPHKHTHVIRKRDLIDLFDTTPDLAGNDIDIDRYVRDIEDTDVRVYWRDWNMNEHKTPPNEKAWRRVGRDELCPVPIGDFKKFAESTKVRGMVWRWDFLDGEWRRVNDKSAIYPGQTYLVHTSAGGYDPDMGWTGGNAAVDAIDPVESQGLSDNAYDDEGLSKTDRWQTIADHTDQVCKELEDILASVPLNNGEVAALRTAARWHDWGKSHEVFQSAPLDDPPKPGEVWAKAGGPWKRYCRRHFRHELASALAVLQRPHPDLGENALSNDDLNLVAYLVAAHHGKVRLSIRSLPHETRPPATTSQPRRFARGVWDGDELPGTDLGQDKDGQRITAPAVTPSLAPMELGLCEQPPFADADQRSWIDRMLGLRDTLGPFRLAYLEALLRAADWRASASAKASSTPTQPRPKPHTTGARHA